jgi:hypothetical protein
MFRTLSWIEVSIDSRKVQIADRVWEENSLLIYRSFFTPKPRRVWKNEIQVRCLAPIGVAKCCEQCSWIEAIKRESLDVYCFDAVGWY